MLKSPELWSTVIAVLALILSQLPPVRQMLTPRSLRMFAPDSVSLSHYLGNLQVWAFLALNNTGGRNITVQRIECVITGDDCGPWRLPSQTYTAAPAAGQSNTELLMGWVSLKPDEHWAETVRFYRYWSVPEEEETAGINASIRNDIDAKLSLRKPEDANKRVDADPELVEKAKRFFDKKFTLAQGNYRLLIAALSEKSEVLCVRGFAFTLFDHQVKTMRSASDDYKHGWGICYPSDPSKGSAFIRLRPIADADAKAEYARLPVI